MTASRPPPFAHQVLTALAIALGVSAAALMGVAAHPALLIVFLGVLVGVVLHGIAGVLAGALRTDPGWTLRGILVASASAFSSAAYFGGDAVVAQFAGLVRALPDALARARAPLARTWPWLLARLPDAEDLLHQVDPRQISVLVSSLGGAIASVMVVLFIGVYLSLTPQRYVANATRLLPPWVRPRALEVLGLCHRALERWLFGRLADMIASGLLTGAGLALLGIPFAAPLALTAATLAFVPFIGPLLSVLPAVLVGLQGGARDALAVTALYASARALERYAISPWVVRDAPEVPPALALAVQAVFGVLAGVLGVMVATPTIVIGLVLVHSLWFGRSRHDVEDIPGKR